MSKFTNNFELDVIIFETFFRILATRPEDGTGFSDEETPSQAKSRQTEQDRIMDEWSQRENERIRQCASTQENNNTDNNNHQNSGTMQIQSSGNGVVVIGSNDFN